MASLMMFCALTLSFLCIQVAGLAVGGKSNGIIKPYKREILQDIVSADALSYETAGICKL